MDKRMRLRRLALIAGGMLGFTLGTLLPASAAVTTTHLVNDGQLVTVLPSETVAAEGRIGDRGGPLTFEADLGPSTAAPDSTAQFDWISGMPEEFTLSYDPATNLVQFTVCAVVVLTYTPAGSFSDIFLRTRAVSPGTTVVTTDLVLDGTPIADSASATGPGLDILWIAGGGLADGFMLTGHVTLSWSGTAPTDSNLAFQLLLGTASGCATAAQCDDQNACTSDTCESFQCSHTPIPLCVGCAIAADCDDANACTTDTCTEGTCGHLPIADCVTCASTASCDDHNACTTDTCTAGRCAETSIQACTPCVTATDCDDGDPCTTDRCTSGSCSYETTVGCRSCTDAPDCDDHDGCTADACDPDGVCVETPTDCPAAPTPEICGDCIDNDGDGLIDGEDPDCCTQVVSHEMQSVALRRYRSSDLIDRVRMRLLLANPLPPDFDLGTRGEDTTVQIADDGGQLYCETILTKYWKSGGQRHLRFADGSGRVAAGLRAAKFKTTPNGQVVFNTQGRAMHLRAVEGSTVRLTVHAGGQCVRSSAQVRPVGRVLVFP